MLYNCSCDQKVIDIPTKLYCIISDAELERLCMDNNNGCQISNIWYGSYTETQGVILTSDEVEERNEKEYEEDENPIQADLNVEEDYWS
jgi:hypothetical protein